MANSWVQVLSEVQRLASTDPELAIEVADGRIVAHWSGAIDPRWSGPTSGPRSYQGDRNLDYRLTVSVKDEAKGTYDWSETSLSAGTSSASAFKGKSIQIGTNAPQLPEQQIKDAVFGVLKANGWKPKGLFGRLFG